MSTSVEFSEHFPLPLNAAGLGPENDPARVVTTVCWTCEPVQQWPCEIARENPFYALMEPPD
jgi:hypothetical protein